MQRFGMAGARQGHRGSSSGAVTAAPTPTSSSSSLTPRADGGQDTEGPALPAAQRAPASEAPHPAMQALPGDSRAHSSAGETVSETRSCRSQSASPEAGAVAPTASGAPLPGPPGGAGGIPVCFHHHNPTSRPELPPSSPSWPTAQPPTHLQGSTGALPTQPFRPHEPSTSLAPPPDPTHPTMPSCFNKKMKFMTLNSYRVLFQWPLPSHGVTKRNAVDGARNVELLHGTPRGREEAGLRELRCWAQSWPLASQASGQCRGGLWLYLLGSPESRDEPRGVPVSGVSGLDKPRLKS